MEFLLLIIAFFLLRHIVISKRPILKGKVNGLIFLPLFSLLLCYALYKSSDEFLNQTLTNIDSLRYVSTYTPYLGEEVHAIAQFAQNNGYMSDEIVTRSSEVETAFGYTVFGNILSIIAFICCIVWIVNIRKLLLEYKKNEKFIKVSVFMTFGALVLGAFFLFSGMNFLFGNSDNFVWSILLIYTLIAIALIFWHYRSYKKLCLFLETYNPEVEGTIGDK